MAQTLTLIDDLNGSAIAAGGTVKFSIEGVNYEIDLSAENAAELRGVSEKYATAGRRVRRERFAAPSTSSARTQNGSRRGARCAAARAQGRCRPSSRRTRRTGER
ncbi:nucleoid-associated protein Lsr2 [Rathayibacter sp. AY1F6]|uniref:Lsr2 dimerization domain-containing protein n=1 Tax=Rathayibacter sp. AY1F6 TaxID=2080560 RepID=UPI000CE88A35|nr:histone-like nucleoid-structuring protein Lsr2 [Rathayibacter sp. AY1F6]PPH05741.1 nucleoid-associated protein Lsr2 [Rathayibacter sp. AY1F6]